MQPARSDRSDLSATLEIARRDLLDLGLRNTLLNFRPLRTRGVEVIDEKPAEVFRLLVKEEKNLTFLPGDTGPLPNPAGGEEPLTQPGDERVVAARHKDSRLQTAYTSAQLQSRLLSTYHAARTSLEEQGVNTLHLALGMLCWCEEDNAAKLCRAPLILIPVQLERSDARARFHLKYSGEELGENISLAEKLKQSFGIKGFPELPDPDELDVAGYFQKVQQIVEGRKGWTVDTEAIALSFFSFAKFLMYRDLDPSTWPAADGILGNDVLESLLADCGFAPCSSNYREDCLLDDQLPNRELVHVVDADSSQTIAILDSLDGKSMVIQGPPGTGKSQTIVNLIAGAVAKGQRVLFVSEKMAALDVVKRRLDDVRLGAACLELHSNRTNKKTIIEELRRTVMGDRQAGPPARAELGLLGDARDRLNQYCKAVNEPVGESCESPCTIYGKLLDAQAALSGIEFPRLALEGAADWTAQEIARRAQLVAQLRDRVTRSGVPVRHPFWGSRLMVLLPTDRDEIRKLALNSGAACAALEKAVHSLSGLFSVEAPATEPEAQTLYDSARYVAGAPELAGVALDSPAWLSKEAQIRQMLAAGKRYRDLHLRFGPVLRSNAWGVDTSAARRSIAEMGGRWWRMLSPGWRRAQKLLDSICVEAPTGRGSQLALLDGMAESAQCLRAIAGAGEDVAGLFAPFWRGTDSDWDLFQRQADWVIGAQKGIRQGALAAWCVDPARIAVDRAAASLRIGEFDSAHQAYQAAVRQWADRLELDESRFPGGAVSQQRFPALMAVWSAQAARIDELHALVAFNQIAAECEKERLGNIAAVAASWEAAAALLVSLFERVRLSCLLERAFRERPALAGFDGVRHANTVAEFRRLDLLQLEYNRALLAAKHAQSLPAGGGAGEIGVLWREFEKRGRFLPIRSLMLKAGHAIQSVKRVFMMSPLSIANYLPPGALTFDLVIFDEASQVRPVDALGAIVRGQQVVVVGDSRQMPPTSFFDSLVGSDDAEPEDEATAASDIESVLGLFCSRGAHQRTLRWHYRSRHESLIAVSNHLFYQDRLVVFPSPDRDRTRLGLIYRRVEDAFYDRSRTRTNPGEAKAVAAAVMAHAESQLPLPRERRETLGVAAQRRPNGCHSDPVGTPAPPGFLVRGILFWSAPRAVLRQEPRECTGRRARTSSSSAWATGAPRRAISP